MEKIIIVGMSTNARHVFEFVTNYNLFEVMGFAVDEQYKTEEFFYDKPVYALEALAEQIDRDEVKLFIALLWNRLNADRRDLYFRLKSQGYQFANIISPKAVVRGKIKGDNCWIHDFVLIQNDAEIGNNVAIMAFSLVGAHCRIEDHCFLGAKSTVGGNSYVGNQTFVGINCTIFDDTRIGKKCILGACTNIKRNMPDYTCVKTSTSFEIKQYDNDTIEEKLIFYKNVR